MHMLVPAIGDAHDRGEADDRASSCALSCRREPAGRRERCPSGRCRRCGPTSSSSRLASGTLVRDAGIGDDRRRCRRASSRLRRRRVGGLASSAHRACETRPCRPRAAISSATARLLFQGCRSRRLYSRPWRKPWRVARPMPMPAPVMRTVSLTASRLRNWARSSGRRTGLPRSEQRKATAAATSSGSPNRPSGSSAALALRQSSDKRPHKRRIDRAGRDRVDADAKRAHFARERFGEADDRRFGSAVVNELDAADLSELRGHVDDDAGLAGEHGGQDGLGHQEHAADMHGEHPVEIRGRQVDEQGLMHMPGVVDEMGGIAKCGPRSRRRSPPRRLRSETSPPTAIAVPAARLDFCRDGFGLPRNASR